MAFYETLGFHKAAGAEGVGFFRAGACAIAVFPSEELAKEANVAFEGIAESSLIALTSITRPSTRPALKVNEGLVFAYAVSALACE